MSDRLVTHGSPVTQQGFTQIPNAVMLRTDMAPLEKLLYGYLKHLAWREASAEIAPLQSVVAEDLGVAEDTVRKALRQLQRLSVSEGDYREGVPKLLDAKRRGRGLANVYTVNDPGPDVAELYFSRTRENRVLEPEETANHARARSLPVVKTEELREGEAPENGVVVSTKNGSGIPSAQTLVGHFIDEARTVDVPVPRDLIGHLARSVGNLLAEGITPEQVWAGMLRMVERRVVQPSLLPNFVTEAAIPKQPARRYGYGVQSSEIREDDPDVFGPGNPYMGDV